MGDVFVVAVVCRGLFCAFMYLIKCAPRGMVLDDKKWKRLEDDVVKAGVMKYGTNKWTKISTLLSKKTPKQCKERWKLISPTNTAFSDTEAVKLLDAVKAFPNQWVAVARCIVGKTPQQCYQMYQQILMQDAVRESRVGVATTMCLQTNDCVVVGKVRTFDKNTATFGVPAVAADTLIVRSGKIVGESDIDYTKFDESERDMIDLTRARLENTKGRKDLKRRMAQQRGKQIQLSKRAGGHAK